MADDRSNSGLVRRLKEGRERHRERNKLYRVLVMLVGFTVTLGGLAMLVLPGPAFVVIPVGLAILALEFAWAERMLDKALEHAENAKSKAQETTGKQRALMAAAVILAVSALAASAVIWDIPMLPV